jgi:hypothetical protein
MLRTLKFRLMRIVSVLNREVVEKYVENYIRTLIIFIFLNTFK